MRLLYGTYNPAKLTHMRRMLSALPVTVEGLTELPNPPEDAEETGETPLENARIKAIHYRDLMGRTVLAADSGLYIDGLEEARQPGVHARRINGARLSDDEMIEYYAETAKSLGGRAVARYRNALCIAFMDGRVVDCFDDSVASEPFYIADTPHQNRTAGFPLDSLSVEIKSGQYYYDLKGNRALGDMIQTQGIQTFVSEALGICKQSK